MVALHIFIGCFKKVQIYIQNVLFVPNQIHVSEKWMNYKTIKSEKIAISVFIYIHICIYTYKYKMYTYIYKCN